MPIAGGSKRQRQQQPQPQPQQEQAAAGNSDKGQNVKGYKPPWIKESAEPNKETETPWGIMKKRDSIMDPDEAKQLSNKKKASNNDDSDDESNTFAIPTLRKVSLTKPPVQENGSGEKEFVRPTLKSVKKTHKEREPKPTQKDSSKINIPKLNSVKIEKMKELPPPPKKETPDYRINLKKTPTKDKIDDEKKRGAPAAPPMPPMPPPPPPPPGFANKESLLSAEQKARLELLRARPKTRPDWTALLKGIESGSKLKHVECNDRSKPLLPEVKAKGQFLYDSEKDNAHNVLLKEIQQGVRLKRVNTNDRSRPNLEGLRKFRRQMTIEEQIQKSVSMASIAPEEIQPDEDEELDDIDKVRDDLQSTKQLLQLEMRNKEQQQRENKRLQTKIANLEKELEIERGIAQNEKDQDKKREPDEKLIITLKAENAEARNVNEDLEKKLTMTQKDLDIVKLELEDMQRKNEELEKRLQEFLTGKRASVCDRRDSHAIQEDENASDEESSTQSDEEETEEKKLKRGAREVKLLVNKLRGFKNKVDNAKKERIALKEIMKKHQAAIKEEKKKYKVLKKDVDKMADLMKESDTDEEEEDEEEDEEAEEQQSESESESSESESESSEESESERSQSEPEDAPIDKRKENYVARMRRHENRLAALKKTNFMLKANAERLQDDLNQQKEMTQFLQADLDSVLAELG